MIPTSTIAFSRLWLWSPRLALACLCPALMLPSHAEQPAAHSIFDGRTLAGWTGNSAFWHVEDGALTGNLPAGTLKGNELLFWHGEVHDFELTAEFRISGGANTNSGIQFRSQRLPNGDASGYRAGLDNGTQGLGRIYEEHGRALLVERGARVSIAPDGRRWIDPWTKPADVSPPFKPGEWNSYRIHASSSHIEIWINAVLVSVLDDHQRDAAALSGLLALQLQGGSGPATVQFRNLRLTHLGRTEPLARSPGSVDAASVAVTVASAIGEMRKNGDPPLRRTANVANSNRAHTSPVLWHLQPNPAKATAVANPAAQALVAAMRLTPGFQAELIAAEPDVHQPIAMAIDPRGRLWIAEAFSYPKRQPDGKGKDRIVIFEDTNGDGSFETRKTFTEGLNLVSGLEVGFGGVWVGAAPHLLFIPDRDQDDRPDGPPEVLLDGWGFQDTHETLNSFTWGPDGWLYGCHGVFTHSLVGKPGTPPAGRAKLRAGVFRYHPVRHEFEVYAHGGSNQWGLDFNELGHLFMTHCRSRNGGGGTTFVIRNGHYWNQANADYAPFISNRGPDFAPELKNFLPASARYDSGEGGAGKPGTTAVFGGHSHVGTMIYLGDNWPSAYRDHLFTHNLHGHQLNHQHNVRHGSGYETFHGGSDLSFVPDPSYMAVDLQYGPDGAVYVIDWSDLQHCHNPRDELWDRTNGRVYRISWAQTYKPVSVNLAAKTDAELVALHTHRSEWFVRTARRLLQERAATRRIDVAALEALKAQLTSSDVAEYLRAFWTLHTVGALDKAALLAALHHPADVVRAWSVQLATERSLPAFEPAFFLRAALDDPSPTVRLALASALPALPRDWRWGIGAGLSEHASDAGDRFLPRMIWFGLASEVAADFGRALDLVARTQLPSLADSLLWFIARTAVGRDAIIAHLGRASGAAADHGVRVLAFALEGEASVTMPAGWSALAARLDNRGNPSAKAAADQLSAVFGDQAVLARTRNVLADTDAPLPQRRNALALLRRVGDTAAMPIYIRLLEEEKLRSDVIPLLAGTDNPAAAAALIRHYPKLSPVDRASALGSLTSRPALALALLDAVSTRQFDRKELTSLHLRQLRNLRDDRVNQRVKEVLVDTAQSSPNAKATVARLKQAYDGNNGSSGGISNGKQVFDRLCTACHRLDGDGGRLGPDLTGSWSNGLDYFLENIVDPNAVVGANFQLNLITKHDGAVISGMVERDTETGLVVRTISETITLPKQQIKHREVIRQSLMPAGLLEGISEEEAVALLKYLVQTR